MKSFIYWWGREDVLFAAAVFPAAIIWIQLESVIAGIFGWLVCYVAIIGLYELLASKRNWPHAAAVNFLKELLRFYNPQ